MTPREYFDQWLQHMVENGASDIIFKSGAPPTLKVSGKLVQPESAPSPIEFLAQWLDLCIPGNLKSHWEENNQVDFSVHPQNVGRFRVNAFFQQGKISIVFRHIRAHIPTFEELNLWPETLIKFMQIRDGIVIVSGATGSGKSSSLAAMLNWLNHNLPKHVVTLEDPIEYTFTDDQCVFNQREIGIDVPTFDLALKTVLRQAPDVILIGEMRDQKTFETALSAAETGHLVLTTMHAATVAQSIERILEFFPPERQVFARRQVSTTLRGIICQKLIPAMEGGGRLPAQEILFMDGVLRAFLADGQYDKIISLLEMGGESGSRTFNRDIMRLIKTGLISKADGLRFSPNPQALEMALKGIVFKA